ncbi:MAG TPA: signal peptide peptidase SppA [Thermoanaerobaculia bacterium]|nr:signal peptide peptidase SppA [Thermoanaerobaculia bacterium]
MSELESPQTVAPPQPPPARKSRAGSFFLGALTGCALVVAGVFFIGILAAAMFDGDNDISLGEKVAVIAIEGEIMEARETVDAIEKYSENASVKALVIRINSPGGAIAPSQEIYSAIRHARAKSGKPIVASLDSVAASGGYYIAAACDQIVANPGTITGSIGVILQWFDMKELVQWAKLKPETITSGALKDAGSPGRALTPQERQYFQGIVAQLHSQFVRDVARGRGTRMKHEEVARVADGRIFTGEQALQLKLIDQLGSVDDAVRAAGKLAGIDGEPTKLWPKPREERLLELLTGGEANAALERIISRRLPQFLYKW